jgi:cellulose synthase/poly-beta-1,6-N-acetylglucosamine synthase-like glycosyltransferase
MSIFAIISYLICVVYVAMIIFYIMGWKRVKLFEEKVSQSSVFVSVIVPMRNEAGVILNLLKALEEQKYRNFEVVIINDHSTDNSAEIVANYISKKKHFRLVSATGEGKKNALREAIPQCSAELIVCTDADCIPNIFWLNTLCAYYEENKPDMIIMPVVMMFANDSAFEQMQALEFMSLQAVTAGAACAGFPIMCNGANLAFTKEAWEKNRNNLKEEKRSGDDMFLMMSLKKQKGKIAYLKSDKAVVFTKPAKNLSEFLNQRKRWASKSTAYYDKDVIFAAITVFSLSLVLILNLIFGIFIKQSYLIVFAFIFFTKIAADRLFLHSFSKFVRSKQLLKWIFFVSLVYPFYIVFTTFSGLFGKFEWKGR